MKLVLICLIGAFASLQVSAATEYEWMGTPIFDLNMIFDRIRSAEKSSKVIFSGLVNMIRASPLRAINGILNIRQNLYNVLSSQVDQSMVNLHGAHNEADNMVKLFNSSLCDLVNCLLNNTANATAFIKDIRNTTRSCIAAKRQAGVTLIQSLWKNFTDFVNTTRTNLQTTNNICKPLQNGLFDVPGAICRWKCLVKLRRDLRKNSGGFFGFVRNAVIQIANTANSTSGGIFECVRNATSAIREYRLEVLSNCRNQTN